MQLCVCSTYIRLHTAVRMHYLYTAARAVRMYYLYTAAQSCAYILPIYGCMQLCVCIAYIRLHRTVRMYYLHNNNNINNNFIETKLQGIQLANNKIQMAWLTSWLVVG